MFDEKNQLPDLPPSRRAFDSFNLREQDVEEEEESEMQALPAFPDSPSHNKFSEAVIKDAVRGVDDEDLPELPELPCEKEEKSFEFSELEKIPGAARNPKIVEMEEWNLERSLGISKMEYPKQIEIPRREDFLPIRKKTDAQDVFIKIEKFRTAKKTFNELKNKLNEIDDLIKKIRETKMREEQELSAWEKDVTQIKSRVKEVSENIFEKAG